MEKLRLTLLAATALWCCAAFSQSEAGLTLSAEAEKKIDRKLSIGLEAGLRTRNDFRTADRWSLGVSAAYKFNKWLKADAGYQLLDYNNREKVTYYTSGAGNAKIKWRPSYWGVKHRLHASLTGGYKFAGGLKLTLRERWQHTYRPEAETERYKLNIGKKTMTADEGYVRNGKGKNQLRSRLGVEYDKKRAVLTPYASAELYNAWAVEKVRYTVGTGIKLAKQHSLDVFYRFQNVRTADDDDFDPDMHYVGVGYKFKF